MANIKITDLTAYGNPTSTDVLPIVDVGADVTKKVSVADLLENAGSGTASAPGIAFDGDSNTGIYRPGADQLAISTNGTGRLFVDANGNVGINTAAGSATGFSNGVIKSKAITGAPGLFLEASSSNSWWGVYGGTGLSDSAAVVYPNGGSLRIATTTGASVAGFSEKLRITSDGKVGLGTSSPGARLAVEDSFTAAADTNDFVKIARNGGSVALSIGYDAVITDMYVGTSTNHSLQFRTNNQIRQIIDTAGNVGIGVTSPSSLLHLADAGDITVGTTTGTKIGTATSQKIGFYNATPVAQPTTGVAEAAFVENSGGTAVNVDSTFGGYTIQQVVEALQTLGLLA